MDPLITAGLIGAGGSIAGGVIGNLINQNQVENEATRNQFNLTHGISMRVADAKRAGLHPLYALGAPTFNSSPIMMEDRIGPSLINAGQNVSSAIARTMSTDEKVKNDLEVQLLNSQIKETDARAGMYISETAKNNQAGLAGTGIQLEKPGGVQGIEGQSPLSMGAGIIDVKPSPQISAKQGHSDVIAGIGQTHEERWLENGFPMITPRLEGESLEEILSEMSTAAFLGLLQRNANMYGDQWLRDFIAYRYAGELPKGKYKPMLQLRGEMGKEGGNIFRRLWGSRSQEKRMSLDEKIKGAYKHLERR